MDYAKRFYALHLENRRRLGLPAPPWRFFRLVAEIMGACGGFEVWLASAGGRDLGSVVLLKDRDSRALQMERAHRRRASGTMQLLFGEICERYAGEFETFDLGRTDAANDGLSRFKREMGATRRAAPLCFLSQRPRADQQRTSNRVRPARWPRFGGACRRPRRA